LQENAKYVQDLLLFSDGSQALQEDTKKLRSAKLVQRSRMSAKLVSSI